MFWILLLAHLLADYALQTDRMVLAKKRLPGLLLHVAIHLVTMAVLVFPVLATAWPYLLLVGIFHFFIDAFKNFLSTRRPQWIAGPYLLDQSLHLASLILVMVLMDRRTDLPVWAVISPWVVYASGLLTATYVWFISERIFTVKDKSRQLAVLSTMWPRMGARLLLFVLAVAPYSFTLLLALLAAAIIFVLYRRYNYLRSWLVIDGCVAVITALIVRAILLVW